MISLWRSGGSPGRGQRVALAEGPGGVVAQPCGGIFLCWFCPGWIPVPAPAGAFAGAYLAEQSSGRGWKTPHLPPRPVLAPVGSGEQGEKTGAESVPLLLLLCPPPTQLGAIAGEEAPLRRDRAGPPAPHTRQLHCSGDNHLSLGIPKLQAWTWSCLLLRRE